MESGTISNRKKITFRSEGFLLEGTLHLPPATPAPVVIGSHGLFSSSSSPKQLALAEACTAHGIAFFRYDHRGCGRSEGDFRTVTSLNGRCRDLSRAIETTRAMPQLGEAIGLFGSSFGGTVCLSLASRSPSFYPIEALVTFAAPINSRSVLQGVAESSEAAFFLSPEAKPNFEFDISRRLKKLRRCLIFHGDEDTVVPVSHADEIFEDAAEPKKMIRQAGGDHRMSGPKDQQIFLWESVQWYQKWLLGRHGSPPIRSTQVASH